ncbi:unnamed protein product [Psylliodes chrysocephalus]|uniref:Uncharacterized protein n=1 Tax=Psylliodes chrysocephalus TaxID=3402493 RepID=A0A9P0G3X9_9CUCU|nr:unnamed protein product [Psylliodes chrysocephala]
MKPFTPNESDTEDEIYDDSDADPDFELETDKSHKISRWFSSDNETPDNESPNNESPSDNENGDEVISESTSNSLAKDLTKPLKWFEEALRPVKYREQLSIPKAPAPWSLDAELESTGSLSDVTESAKEMTTDPLLDLPGCSTAPHLISQGELNDLVRDLSLSKSQSELLAS